MPGDWREVDVDQKVVMPFRKALVKASFRRSVCSNYCDATILSSQKKSPGVIDFKGGEVKSRNTAQFIEVNGQEALFQVIVTLNCHFKSAAKAY